MPFPSKQALELQTERNEKIKETYFQHCRKSNRLDDTKIIQELSKMFYLTEKTIENILFRSSGRSSGGGSGS